MQHLTLAEISEKLKSQRLDRDFTLEQVEEQTKISKRFIIAIEESKFDVFPALMYLYGFVTNLCELYQIDSEQILNSLKYQLTASNQEETAASEDVETHLQDKQQPPLRGKSNAKIAIYSLSIVLILLIVFVVKVSLNENPQITSITLDNVVTQATIYKMNSEKETFDLKLKDSVNILFDNSYQKLVIDSIADNEVKFYLNDIEFKLNEAAQQSLDLNEDEIDDIEIKLKKISGELVIVHISQINYKNKSFDYQAIWDSQEQILVGTEYTLFKNQEKTPIEVYIKALKLPSHLSYNLDGKRQNTTMLDTGKDIIISAEEHLEVIIGNYKSVMIMVNKIPINLTLDNDKHSVTKIIKWIPDANNETRFDLIIKDYVN